MDYLEQIEYTIIEINEGMKTAGIKPKEFEFGRKGNEIKKRADCSK